MLTEKESAFVHYWENNRIKEARFMRKVMGGLPMALIFCLPILLFIGIVYLYFPEWYTKISDTSVGSLVMAVISVFGAVLFFAYFRMHFKWEMNEQQYLELKNKSS